MRVDADDLVDMLRHQMVYRETPLVKELMEHLGQDVTMKGQEWMFVGVEGGRAVFENEDERLVHTSYKRALALLEKKEVEDGDEDS
jgi:hypothetical protein